MSAQRHLASGRIDSLTTLTLYPDGTFSASALATNAARDQLVSMSFDIDSMRRKSVTGRGAAFLLTGGMSILASNNRGVLYVTITGQRSGTKTYTTKNPSDNLLSSVRSLKAAADALLASPRTAFTPQIATGGPYAHHPVLAALPIGVRAQIEFELGRNRPIAAIKVLRENMPMSLKDAKDTIDRLREFPDEGTPPTHAQHADGEALTEVTASTQPSDGDLAAQLKALAELHQTGALSDEEFAAAKARVLS